MPRNTLHLAGEANVTLRLAGEANVTLRLAGEANVTLQATVTEKHSQGPDPTTSIRVEGTLDSPHAVERHFELEEWHSWVKGTLDGVEVSFPLSKKHREEHWNVLEREMQPDHEAWGPPDIRDHMSYRAWVIWDLVDQAVHNLDLLDAMFFAGEGREPSP